MMHKIHKSIKLLITLLSSVQTAHGFWRMSCPSRLVQERADPIVSPGNVSGHVHTIAGGNGFSFEMNYAKARSSKCSSCQIKQDLSNYWTPKLYYQAQNGSFIGVPESGDGNGVTGGMTVYYEQRPGPNNDKLLAFPKGFRMIAGDPFKRAPGNDFASLAVQFVCLDYNGVSTQTYNLPNKNCPDGLRPQIYFPSCWDGVNLDSADHKSHVSYPANNSYDNGPCPASHPVHLISIFYEQIYSTDQFADMWYGNSQPFVFAQGDPTGYGFHGDFLNGWDVNTLQAAVDDCNDPNGIVENCQHFDLFTDTQCHACSLPPEVNEDVDGPMAQLPGCNPVQPGPAEAINYATQPSCHDTAKITKPPKQYTDLTKSKHWRYLGCGTDDVNNRTLTGSFGYNNTETVELCVNNCISGGYKFAGLEYSTQCFCGNTLPADRAPVKGVNGGCSQKCGGDASEYCGGPSFLSIYESCKSLKTCKNA